MRSSIDLYSLGVCVLFACADNNSKHDMALAYALGHALEAACPSTAPEDEPARATCADALTGQAILRDHQDNPFLWGQQLENDSQVLPHEVTRFEPRVWRRLYLSLYSFPRGATRVEPTSYGGALLRMRAEFRSRLDPGSYPYPFWHRPNKWEAYQLSSELVFVIFKGRIRGAMRSAERDVSKPLQSREWDGLWRWHTAGQTMPYVTLFTYLFSSDNPHTVALDAAYRELEGAFRQETCFVCHSPDNASLMPELELLTPPNQALAARHRIVKVLEHNEMPVADARLGLTDEGIADDSRRLHVLDLARRFAELGDEALAYEGEER